MRLFKSIYNKFESAYDKKISSSGLAVFRIFWGIVLFLEVAEMSRFKELRFDVIPFLQPAELKYGPILFIWEIVVLLIILGFKTRLMTIINYVLSLLFFGCIITFEYHVFYVFLGVNFLLIFIPLSQSYSIDNLIRKIKFSRPRYFHHPNNKVTVLYYYLPILLGLAFVYFDSFFFKLTSPTWMSGLGMWRPSVLTNFNISDMDFLLNQEWIIKTLGYLTVVFEGVFIFLFWFKRFRLPLLIIGFFLHLGIFIIFPIPLFALSAISIYVLMLPAKFWSKLKSSIVYKNPIIHFIYDEDCPLCTKTATTIESLNFFKTIQIINIKKAKSTFAKSLEMYSEGDLINSIHSVSKSGVVYKGIDTYIQVLLKSIILAPIGLLLKVPGIYHVGKLIYIYIAETREREVCNEDNCIIYYPPDKSENKKLLSFITLRKLRILSIASLFLIFSFFQLNSTLRTPLVKTFVINSGIFDNKFGHTIDRTSVVLQFLTGTFFGVSGHPVFMDGHYSEFQDLFALTFVNAEKEEWLPIIDERGKPGLYNTGGNWVNWTFRVNSLTYHPDMLKDGIIRYTAFWLGDNNIPVNNSEFIIKHKKVYSPSEFEYNLLQKLENIPWKNVGNILWKDLTPIVSIDDTLLRMEHSSGKIIQ